MTKPETRKVHSKPRLVLPLVLIACPLLLIATLWLAMSGIYSVFHPPAIFDEIAPDTTATEKVAYATNVFLVYAIFASLLLGAVSVVAGVVLLFLRLWRSR